MKKNRARPPSRALAIAALPIALGACLGVEDEVPLDFEQTENPLASSVSGVGPDGGIDWSIDAPWRMEPTLLASGQRGYDPIPITITFHDADMQGEGDELPVNRFCGVDILEHQPGETWTNARVTSIDVADFHEIEATLRWTAQGILTPTPAGEDAHVVRRIWNGDSPEDVLAIAPWAEWHGTFMYEPEATPAGNEVRLIVMARVSKFDGVCTPLDLNRFQLMYQLKRGKVSRYPAPPGSPQPAQQTTDSIFFSDFLRVAYGSDPLPRFDIGWVYGDVHFHSQGTDNEGESALNFRGSLAAMKAMGLDYAFATDHTSGGTQVSGAGILVIDVPPIHPAIYWIPIIGDIVENAIAAIEALEIPVIQRDALRDMNLEKFRALRAWLNDADGANAQVATWGTSWRAPQMFLGAEVDVIPELSDAEAAQGFFEYAKNVRYDVREPCSAVLDVLEANTNWVEICEAQMTDTGSAYGRKAIRDVQGLGDIGYFSRQHLVHLPTDPTDDDQIIISNTSNWGGATLSLKTVVEDHLAAQQKGYAFLAHPADASSGDGAVRLGPDMVPYSDAQLEVAFASPHIIGLQLWNGNSHVTSSAPELRPSNVGGGRNFPFLDKIGVDDPELPGYIQSANLDWTWEELTPGGRSVDLKRGTQMWDKVNLWGITPARTAAIGLGAGVFRKTYMAGGSDAHGDLNYRRNGRILGVFYSTDSQMGSPRNLTFVGGDRPVVVDDGGAGVPTVGQAQIVEALRTGHFSVTDGPALRIAIDQNNNGQIDAGDAQMGDDFTLTGATAPVLVQWKSTAEFGPVRELDLYVGVQAGTRPGVVYAPALHGPNLAVGEPCIVSQGPILDPEGNAYCPMADGYVRDEQLHIDVAATPGVTGYDGTVRFDLDPRDFKVFDLHCTTTQIPAPTEDGEPPAWQDVTSCRVDRTQVPGRLFVRAFAQTDDTIDGFDTHRFAYTNPVWLHGTELPAPATATLSHASCTNNTNTFTAAVSPSGAQREWRYGSTGAWTAFSGSTFTVAAGGQKVWLRARVCNATGCSGYVLTSATGTASCPAPIPSPPFVKLEYTGCYSGVNKFAATVAAQGSVPATSVEKQKKITSSGAWTTLSGTLITAGSQQTVYLRARSCNANGCSSYAQTSKAGPTCSGGGGPLPP